MKTSKYTIELTEEELCFLEAVLMEGINMGRESELIHRVHGKLIYSSVSGE